MPSRAPIVVNDGEPTPVAHTYAPTGGTATLSSFRCAGTAITAAGWESMNIEIAPPSGGRATFKAQLGWYNPVEEDVDGVPTVVVSDSGQMTFNFPPNSTEQQRENAVVKMINFLSNASVQQAIVKMEPFY